MKSFNNLIRMSNEKIRGIYEYLCAKQHSGDHTAEKPILKGSSKKN